MPTSCTVSCVALNHVYGTLLNSIEGMGIVALTFTGKDGTEVQLLLEATAKQRLVSPHTLMCKETGKRGSLLEMRRSLS
jgi:hypothetical protein